MIIYECDFCKYKLNETDKKMVDFAAGIYGYMINKEDNKDFEIIPMGHDEFNGCNKHICYDCFKKIVDWQNLSSKEVK